MSAPTALLTFSIGPVHSFIDQARRVADLWAGSDLLSHLIGQAVRKVQAWDGAEMIFPSIADGKLVPPGLPNRFVCRVPQAQADDLARALKAEVEAEWNRRVKATVEQLKPHGLGPAENIWTENGSMGKRQTDHLLEIAWSWVPENGSYALASLEGARRFAASRLFRPFSQIEEGGEKCAVCGERAALPDGNRPRVRECWEDAAARSEKTPDEPYLRKGQGRLCLACATKRFYPAQREKRQWFESFQNFEPSEETPYFALVALDGDRMGDILGWPESRLTSGDAERFHRELSRALSQFAESLRTPGKADLNLEHLGYRCRGLRNAQLIYAGGEDILLVCDPRDALAIAWRIHKAYRNIIGSVAAEHALSEDRDRFTISAAVLFAHSKYPAGLLFRDVQRLLEGKAKHEAGRDAVAIRLAKRGGVPVETAFRWEERAGSAAEAPTWVDSFDWLVAVMTAGDVSSRQTFTLRRHEDVLTGIFMEEDWRRWLRDRLSRREPSDAAAKPAEEIAQRLAPFFLDKKTMNALRILRFLVREIGDPEPT